LFPPPSLSIITIGTVGMLPLKSFTDELGGCTAAIDSPYKMGKNGKRERFRDPACDAHIKYLELAPTAASPARLAAAANNSARESARGYPSFQPPPIAGRMPIAERKPAEICSLRLRNA
jgi:hypothetical protein